MEERRFIRAIASLESLFGFVDGFAERHAVGGMVKAYEALYFKLTRTPSKV